MNTIDLNNLKFVDGSFTKGDDFSYLLIDNDGSFTNNNELMYFECDGKDLEVEYTLYVDGTISSDPGDWYTPGYTDVEIDDLNIDISKVTIDGVELVLSNEDYRFLTKLIEAELEY